jgi:hypothetical protein
MKNLCISCQYQRAVSEEDAKVEGHGFWCSNSQSPIFLARLKDGDGCDQFQERGKKAPLLMRAKVKVMGLVNKFLRGRTK